MTTFCRELILQIRCVHHGRLWKFFVKASPKQVPNIEKMSHPPDFHNYIEKMTSHMKIKNVWCNALYLLHKWINSHKVRLNLFGLLTNSTKRICLVVRGGRELVTFRSHSSTFSSNATYVDKQQL